jgi:hypothetical protein
VLRRREASDLSHHHQCEPSRSRRSSSPPARAARSPTSEEEEEEKEEEEEELRSGASPPDPTGAARISRRVSASTAPSRSLAPIGESSRSVGRASGTRSDPKRSGERDELDHVEKEMLSTLDCPT